MLTLLMLKQKGKTKIQEWSYKGLYVLYKKNGSTMNSG